ncbi:hypothetical protein LPJ78_002146 [Coemansia sp. RSA 989]|nr:major facilitator superfamily domain-containing protein [Coemansia mojavensis]KAJ1742877.1 hypothetical protein LPJ68_001472 [Coemansia sp. RSA 1086]KAJ1749409.1 hypothetical protein LPJ79_003737 [Coemansia sp. RSA 1821]KAJ1866050.1 hypothetical protein LPJ78_002146 [Coemansia sp. RSA 989]KAJ1873292.1 hypothetical protein LPJ55_002445 [Coemansia sp. RSA 990]KAJ2628767.1 hypothetical protein H4R22_003705 [Coemansia sp. RSA 1290]KAJ2648171.1 hypothetical protein IWW40_004149 [Coemansia sp. R
MDTDTAPATLRHRRHMRRAVAMLGACLATTTAGTVYLFSTYGPALSHRLHLTSMQSNVVAISANYGLLLSGPFFGWAADSIGPRILSLFAAAGSFSAFSALAFTYSGDLPLPNWLALSLYMVLVGLSAQSANMAAVTTTTKNFKQNRGTAVSLCIAFFGLSPFVLSHINSLFFTDGEQPNTFGYLRFLSVLGLTTSMVAALCLSVVGFGPSRSRIPPGFIVNRPVPSDSSSSGLLSDRASWDEERALNSSATEGFGAIPKASNNSSTQPRARIDAESSSMSSSTAQQPIAQLDRQRADGLDYDTARDLGGWTYLRDSEAQLLMLVLFLCAGIGVFYNNNVGTIVNALYYSSTENPNPNAAQRLINHHVAVVSLGSFAGRLIIGIVADTCKRLWRVPRSGILVVVALCVVASQLMVAAASTLPLLLVGSAMTGLSYGFTFGFVPTLVSVWFGTRHFGSNWGLTSMFIGFSGQALGAFFGYVYDSNLPDQDPSKCYDGRCYRSAFGLSVVVGFLGMVAAAALAKRRSYRRKENRRRWEAEEVDHIQYVPFVLAE